MLTRRTFALSLPITLAALSARAQDGPAADPAAPGGEAAGAPSSGSSPSLSEILERGERLPPLKAVIVSRDGENLVERGYHGYQPTDSTNIKSASKSIISAMVGIAIDKGLLQGVDQPIAPLLKSDLPENPDPQLSRITIGQLLSMQSGLGPSYGRMIASRNWVRFTLADDFVEDPGGAMVYSTASTHLLSAILAKAGGKPTLQLAEDWFRPVDGFRIGSWSRDRQGVHIGGNQMAMTPRSLHAFGELYRRGGVTEDGTRVISEAWIRESWIRRTNSVFNGDGYGYAWFLKEMAGQQVNYAWGYGGQMLYITPSLGLTVAMTSNEAAPSARTGYRDELHGLMTRIIETVGA